MKVKLNILKGRLAVFLTRLSHLFNIFSSADTMADNIYSMPINNPILLPDRKAMNFVWCISASKCVCIASIFCYPLRPSFTLLAVRNCARLHYSMKPAACLSGFRSIHSLQLFSNLRPRACKSSLWGYRRTSWTQVLGIR